MLGLSWSALTWIILAQPAAVAPARGADPRCGGYCLYLALGAMGPRSGTLADLEKQLGPPPEAGYSMAQLADTATRAGASTLAVSTTLDRLRARPRPFACIALLQTGKQGHFVLIKDITGTTVEIIDPPSAYSLPIDTFRVVWTGKALLVARAKLVPEDSIRLPWTTRRWIAAGLLGLALIALAVWLVARLRRASPIARLGLFLILISSLAPGCGRAAAPVSTAPPRATVRAPEIVVEPAVHRLGDLLRSDLASSSITAETRVTNRGGADLVLRPPIPKCGCTDVRIDRTTIAPGQHATLISQIRLGDTAEPRVTGVYLDSNDPKTPRTEIVYQWTQLNPLGTDPPAPDEVQLQPQQQREIRLELVSRGVSICPRCSIAVRAASPSLTCRFSEKEAARSQAHGVSASLESPRSLGVILITIRGEENPGSYSDAVQVCIDCSATHLARFEFPVRWSIHPVVQVVPSRLALGIRKPREIVKCHFLVESSSADSLRILGLRCEDPGIVESTHFDPHPGQRLGVEITVRLPGATGPCRTMLHVDTNDPKAPELTIPLSALISE